MIVQASILERCREQTIRLRSAQTAERVKRCRTLQRAAVLQLRNGLLSSRSKVVIMIYMAATKTNSNKWSDEDRRNFGDRNILRAQTIPNKKRVARRRACRDKARWD